MGFEIYFASENPEKVRVVQRVWGDRAQIKTLRDISTPMPQGLEVGYTYEQNAFAKAKWLFGQTGCTTIADDSGMEIKGLSGSPGVLTKRWAGESSDEDVLIAKTIDEISRLPESGRACDFVMCAVAIIDVRNRVYRVEKDTGILLLTPRGERIPGHPLASLLWIPEKGATLAELRTDTQFEAKDIRAHRNLRTEILKFI